MSLPQRPEPPDEFIRLDRTEALRLLKRVLVGRLLFTMGALPAVRPVNFAFVDGMIVLRASVGSAVTGKVDRAIVAFEVDELDAATCSGWSVTVTGRAAVITGPGAVSRFGSVLPPRTAGSRDRFITITTDLVEGVRTPGSHSSG